MAFGNTSVQAVYERNYGDRAHDTQSAPITVDLRGQPTMLSSLKVPVQLAQAEKEVSACRAKSDAFVPLVEMTAVRQVRFW